MERLENVHIQNLLLGLIVINNTDASDGANTWVENNFDGECMSFVSTSEPKENTGVYQNESGF